MTSSVICCCLFIGLFAVGAVSLEYVYQPRDKPGSCPSMRYNLRRMCPVRRIDPCRYDYQCPGNQKCCRMNCGRYCTNPVFRAFNCADYCEKTCAGEHKPDPRVQCDCVCPAFNICDRVKCPVGQHCELKRSVPCISIIRCPPLRPVCVPDECSPVQCKMLCEFGFVERNGCQVCECKPNPCDTFICKYNYKCKLEEVTCKTSPCPRQPRCVNENRCQQDDDVKCMLCQYGYVEDDGCPTCKCKDNPCEIFRCKVGQICKLVTNDCDTKPCYPEATCVDRCPQIKCFQRCHFGFVYENGCQTCKCKPNPCSMVKCSRGSRCEVKEVACVKAPCPSQATCVNTGVVLPLLRCPRTLMKRGTVGICLEACSSDEDCSNGELCCSNGCGHTCVKGVGTMNERA